MDFEVKGYPLQEGQGRLLVSGITDQMLQHSRAQLIGPAPRCQRRTQLAQDSRRELCDAMAEGVLAEGLGEELQNCIGRAEIP